MGRKKCLHFRKVTDNDFRPGFHPNKGKENKSTENR